jgi:hypothetical protein
MWKHSKVEREFFCELCTCKPPVEDRFNTVDSKADYGSDQDQENVF